MGFLENIFAQKYFVEKWNFDSTFNEFQNGRHKVPQYALSQSFLCFTRILKKDQIFVEGNKNLKNIALCFDVIKYFFFKKWDNFSNFGIFSLYLHF